jgi:hypothetical protein
LETDLIISMSPLIHSLTSRTKKSMLGLPIPMLTIERGTPRNLPVMVRNPLSEDRTNGFGSASSFDAIVFAREGEPTVIWKDFRTHSSDPECDGGLRFCLRSPLASNRGGRLADQQSGGSLETVDEMRTQQGKEGL